MWIAVAAAAVTGGVAVVALWKDPRAFVHRVFCVGLLLFALDAGLAAYSYMADAESPFLLRQWLQLFCASLLPSVWLLFSVTFARANYTEQLNRWRWVLLVALIIPLGLTTFFREAFFAGPPMLTEHGMLFVPTAWSGYVWHLAWVILSVMILMNLERTFRHATGYMRWQTKFLFLGIGGVFAAHLYTDSQVLLFRGINTGLDQVEMGVLLLADLFILRALFRGKPLTTSIYLSHQFLFGSFTALIVGIFFITLGVLALLSLQFAWIVDVHVMIFLVLVAVMVFAAVLMSDRLRMRLKRFIGKHFRRPQYDYRKIWQDFTGRTASLMETQPLCREIVKMVSETLEILSVSIWLLDERQERWSFGASTVYTNEAVAQLKLGNDNGMALARTLADQSQPVDLEGRGDDWVEDLRNTYGFAENKEARIRYCVPLQAAGRLIGIMTLSEKVFYEPLTVEETDLVKTVADQAAASLLSLRLSEELNQRKESEAFRTMSSFFLHDLKNLASKLSLVTQNLPVHMDNPEFRADALRTMTQSVTKINALSSRLSLLSQKLVLDCHPTDLNDLVTAAVSEARGIVRTAIHEDLGPLPPLSLDGEQVHKVIENLLINARDALGEEGEVHVATRHQGVWAEIAVTDNGCGMSGEFMAKRLFHPFQTTKKQGMGIGLYHCRAIVEAHGGRIEVESEEGRGTCFRVLLPLEKGASR